MLEDETSRDEPEPSIAVTPDTAHLELSTLQPDGTRILPLGDYLMIFGKLVEVRAHTVLCYVGSHSVLSRLCEKIDCFAGARDIGAAGRHDGNACAKSELKKGRGYGS